MKIFIGEGRKPSCQHPAWWVTGFLTWPKSLWLHITLHTKPIEHLEDHVSPPWSSDLCTLRSERQGGIVEAKKSALTMLCLAQAHITWLFLKTFRFSQNYAKDCNRSSIVNMIRFVALSLGSINPHPRLLAPSLLLNNSWSKKYWNPLRFEQM